MWQKFYELRKKNRDDRNERRSVRQINKSTSNSRQIDNCDDYSSFEFFNYYRSNRAYNNQKYQFRNFNQRFDDIKRIVSTLFTQQQQQLFVSRQFLRIIDENAFDFKNQKQTRSQKKKFDERNNKNFKRKVYVIDDSDEKNDSKSKSIEKNFLVEYFNDDEQAYYSKNLIYYDSNYSDDTNQESTINHFTVSITIICRRCKKSFVFNNKFHRYIRETDCLNVNVRLKKSFAFYIEKSFIVTTYVATASFVNITKTSSESAVADTNVISIVISNVDVFKDIETDCDYRGWNYAKVEIAFFANVKSEFVCMNTDSEITLADRKFFYRQNSNVSIRIMITSFIVRNINFDQHQIVDYVIMSMYFLNQKNNKIVKNIIRREIHLINNLKTNMLIENNVIDSKKWNMNYIQS